MELTKTYRGLGIGDCISCNPDAPLYPEARPVITAGEFVLPQFSDQPYVQCHLDAKARPGFIVTPMRHIERLSEMDNEELFALWSVAVKAVRYSQLSVWNFCTLPVLVLNFQLQFCAEFCVISIYDLFLSSSFNSKPLL